MTNAVNWRLAKSLVALRSQINDAWPGRSITSDGSIGDARHEAIGKSDHNPNKLGVVTAIDITNDPTHEAHAQIIAEALRASRDKRIKYLIFAHFIMRSYDKPGLPAWSWAPYSGANGHSHHFHISVNADRADDTSPWRIAA